MLTTSLENRLNALLFLSYIIRFQLLYRETTSILLEIKIKKIRKKYLINCKKYYR